MDTERVAIKNNSLFYFGHSVCLCGFPCCPGGGLGPFPRSGWVTPVGLLHFSVVRGCSVVSRLRLLSPGRGLRLYFLIWGISVLISFLPFPLSYIPPLMKRRLQIYRVESGNREGVEEFVKQVISLQPRISQSWVSVDGVSNWEGKQELKVHWKDVFMSGVEPQLGTWRLRDPYEFIAGGLHTNPNAWELILSQHLLAQEILGWIRHKVYILHFR